ncbi:carbon-nitrogen hydrolase family protein [Erythrobacter mangrovi]|uniref:Carbon-nitrogen hydrolase family protein n=1 Tax=Erythrobacter mangrovi TaxID=2739433 RepID=A0A7D3XQN4_9SPHN|nr:carbon-nitrogen hydrolase family protein [Erythrobacter mangrovi]QKG70631.1 carbon-nitrogen hydrolase family protein [Erythrobacter mangrovi]
MARLAALQIGSRPEGPSATLETILRHEAELADERVDLLVLPEAVFGGYPKGAGFGTQLGFRTAAGREEFAAYYDHAIDLDGPEITELAAMSVRLDCSIVAGVIERDGSTLYCTAVYLEPGKGLVAKHRKLMPTGTERLIWGQGDGSTLPVIDSRAGKLAAAICWENYMPMLRMAYYAKGVEIWCAPTVDARPEWQATMRHVALEGRCFVVSACQYQQPPARSGAKVANWPDDADLISGGSVIFGPLGEELAAPLRGSEGLMVADYDRSAIARARYDFDVAGHYARPDIFQLSVDTTRRASVSFCEKDVEGT